MARVVSGFRSGPSRKACFLNVVNRTSRTVYLVWVDYYGRETNYGFVEPSNVKSIHSYEGHPWLCRDASSKRRLLMNNKELIVPYFPNVEISDWTRPSEFPVENIVITTPLFTLQELAADVITKCVSSERDIGTLGLPTKLRGIIVDCFHYAHVE